MTTINTDNGATFAARTGRHMLKRLLAALAVATCMFDANAANQAPTVTMQAPVSGASYVAPAAVTLAVSVSDSDGSIAKVEFFNDADLLGTSTAAPYQFTWTGVAAGTYAVTARATDDLGAQATTVVATVTVANGGAQVYYVYSDQINTPKEITDAAGMKVWQGDSEPFGANLPVQNPAGQVRFTYNLRFPGQYFDRETGLHYNYHRDYDPQTGRYVQSDPIGLAGGINSYAYVVGDPLRNVDPFGLAHFITPNFKSFGEAQRWHEALRKKYPELMDVNTKMRAQIEKNCPSLLPQFDNWTIGVDPYMNNPAKRAGSTFATTNYGRQSTQFNFGYFNLEAGDPSHYDIFAHEFRHTMRQNREISGVGARSIFGGASTDPNEIDADIWAANFWKGKCDCK